MPQDSIINYDKEPVGHASEKVYSLVDMPKNGPYISKVKTAVKTIEEAFERYRPHEICVGFNGGKDCTALIHLVHAVYRKIDPMFKEKIHGLYIRRGVPFPEVEKFIEQTTKKYRLNILTINGRIKDSLGALKTQHPEIKAVIMGTRSTDPYSEHLEPFKMTDPDWPQYMRINPILDWTYQEVWQFIRQLNVPYCPLYDNGYTSLGSMENTHPNPALRTLDEHGVARYDAAYLLVDSHRERDGRN